MPAVNLTRDKTHSLKKSRSVASAVVDFSEMPLAADDYEVFLLPDDAIVTDSFYDVLEAFDAAVTADLGFDGGAELISAGALDAVAVIASNDINVSTGTGKRVTINPSADVTQGKVVIVVEYVEYNLSNGDLTNFSDTV